ncbi:MAG: calcium/sodium antiporter [Clostridia bacterium]|nr:calcium/sodium antiporter [Clostridia bacterium]
MPTFEVIFVAVPLFIIGLLMIIKGGDVFVDAAVNIAKALKIPAFIIGATIVSIATTLPELLVSVMAAAEGSADMSVGNAVGSVTANTALILAISMMAMPVLCDRKSNFLQISLLIAATVTLCIGCITGALSVVASVILAVVFVTFMTLNVVSGKKQSDKLKTENDAPVDKKQLAADIFLFLIGAFALAGGSRFMVDYGVYIAGYFGVSELIISLTIIAIGTSLPELVTTITAIAKKETNLSVGNIIGANIIDITLILPICSLVAGQALTINHRSVLIDLPVCVLVTLVAFTPLLIRQKASRVQGAALAAIYAAYMAVVVLCETGVIAI